MLLKTPITLEREPTEAEYIAAVEGVPTAFIRYHRIKNESGKEIEFEDHFFMKQIYNDISPLQVWLKPPQIGATVAAIVKTLWAAHTKKKDIIYTLPTQSDVYDMGGGKVNRIIAQNPDTLGKWVKDHDTIEQKSVGDNIIYYRGTFTTKAAMMVSSSLNVHDEVDASNPEVMTQYETRLQAQADGWRWYFSHPSLAGFGVDIYWQQSDKKEWFITCEHCKVEQQLKFPDNIDFDRGIYQCSLCKKELSDNTRRYGTWKPTANGQFSGYHISQLMCAWISASKIITDYRDPNKTKQYFWNYVLGLPFADSLDKIPSSVVLKNLVDEVNEHKDRIIIGVDTGLPIHYTMMNKQGVFFHEKCGEPTATHDPYDELRDYMMRWPTAVIIADQGGDLIGIRKLQAEFPGRVFLTYYRKDRKGINDIQWGKDDKFGEVVVDRNKVFQQMVEQLREPGRIRIQGTKEEWLEWAKHFDNVYRSVEQTDYGAEYKWERTGADHFCHTLLYCLVGMSKYSQDLAQIVKKDSFMSGVPTGSSVDGTIRGASNLRKYSSFNSGGSVVDNF